MEPVEVSNSLGGWLLAPRGGGATLGYVVIQTLKWSHRVVPVAAISLFWACPANLPIFSPPTTTCSGLPVSEGLAALYRSSSGAFEDRLTD